MNLVLAPEKTRLKQIRINGTLLCKTKSDY